jgi:hypothetical protein
MFLGIEKETRILDLQKEFSSLYPYLKLEFYRSPASRNKILQKAEKINPVESIKKLTRLYEPGRISIDPKRTVTEVVGDFWELFGLSVLVFRKSGNLWIETSLTDSWTLDKQNMIGESFSNSSDNL